MASYKDQMDFSQEVDHPDVLIVRGERPFNAEPPVAALVEYGVTPEELVYCRNHSPVWELDEESYTVVIDDEAGEGLVKEPMKFTIKQLREDFEHVKVVAALQCAGNRRKEMAAIEPVKGIVWDCGVIANCEWSGVPLRDVLLRVVPALGDNDLDNTHVWFASKWSTCQDDKCYGGSIPLRKALDPEGGVLLGLDMSNQPLNPDHGYPLRLIVPGYTGARWVKWIDHITLSHHHESPNFYQQRDYRILPPHVKNARDAEPVWDTVRSITSLPVNSVVASVRSIGDDDAYGGEGGRGRVRVKGYAMGEGGPGKQIRKVQAAIASPDPEKEEEWVDATITYQDGSWSWTLWEVELDLRDAMAEVEKSGGKREMIVLCRAEDEQGFMQKRECAWNMRGVAFNAYGKGVWTW